VEFFLRDGGFKRRQVSSRGSPAGIEARLATDGKRGGQQTSDHGGGEYPVQRIVHLLAPVLKVDDISFCVRTGTRSIEGSVREVLEGNQAHRLASVGLFARCSEHAG
jgi:hypothetical protein